jgi:S-adenosylmethionine:tRNA ribosyltransferase-isomerase
MRTEEFEYDLSPDSVAQVAIEPRHDSRLLVTSDLTELRFSGIATLLTPSDLLVVNTTKVRAARLVGARWPTGGRSEVLLTKRIDSVRWQALLRPAKKLGRGTIVECGGVTVEILSDQIDGVATVALRSEIDIEAAIASAGQVPLPPYFHGTLDSPDRYQTVFARTIGSSAAPTAALHFTDDVIESLDDAGVTIAHIELQVGLDTFRPMGYGRVEDHVIHTERVRVDDATVAAVNRTRATGGRVIAVGTTVVRALESAASEDGGIRTFEGDTDLFIAPGYDFRVVDAVLTNFHAPRTTLIVMVAAMLGNRWRDVYGHALDSGFRFLSFGDSMYIEIPR